MKFTQNNAQLSYVANIFAASLVVITLHGDVDSNKLYGWLAAILITLGSRIGFAHIYSQLPETHETRKSRKLVFLAGITASGLVWASSPWLIFPEENVASQIFLFFVLMGMTAGTPAVSAPSTIAFICFAQPIFIMLTLRFIYEGGKDHYMMAALTQLYNLVLIMTSLNFARADCKLRAAKEEAEAANLAKSQFIANISHEIRTPMNAIVGINHLLRQTQPTPQQQNYINKSITASSSLLSVINNILDYAKVEAQHTKINQSSFDLQKVLDTVTTLVEFDARKKGISFQSYLSVPHTASLIGDPVKLAQVLSNLAENAIKFTDKGEIRLEVSELEHNDQKVHLNFSVSDTGIGISAKDQNRLFTSFSQVNTGHNRQYGGTGLGLAISQELVKLMGGIIEVNSQVNQGSEFYFSLWFEKSPAEKEMHDSHLMKKPVLVKTNPITPVIKNATILLVEDDELNQMVANDLLLSLGATTRIADSAQQAFEQLEQAIPDLILLDIQLPEVDGYEAIAIIRKDERWKELRVICVTAHATIEEKQKALANGMDDYLTKPIDPIELGNMLVKWLPHKVKQTAPPTLSELQYEEGSNTTTSSREEILKNLDNLSTMLIQKDSNTTFLQKAVDSLTNSSQELHQHLNHQNIESAKLCAHRLRGSINLYGSSILQKNLKDIDEGELESEDIPRIQQALKTEFDLILQLLQERLDSYSHFTPPTNT